MQSIGCLALALLQDDGAVQHDVHLMMIFMGIIMAGLLIGFLGVSVAGVFALRLMYSLQQMAERMEGRAGPMLDKTRSMMEELGPKVHSITTNVEQISYTVRGKVDEFSATASDINRTVQDANKRTQAHVARVDGMVNDALNSAQKVSHTVQEGVRKPLHQIAGIIAGVKRGVEVWVEHSPFKRTVQTEEEYRPYDAPTPPPPPPRYASPNPGGVVAGPTVTTSAGETKRVTPYG